MNLALVSGWFPEETDPATAARRVRDFGLSQLALALPGPVDADREAMRTVGVDAVAVLDAGEAGAADATFAASFAAPVAAAAKLRAPRVVAEGGGFGARETRVLARAEAPLRGAVGRGETPEPDAVLEKRGALRETVTLEAVRALHGALAGGTPVAVRNGGEASALLGFVETGWVLDELRGLTLAFDPARALRLYRLGLGPEPEAWAERFARRMSLVMVQGLGPDLSGRCHPEDVAPSWRDVADAVPRAAPWLLDLAPSLAAADVEDAVRYIESQR